MTFLKGSIYVAYGFAGMMLFGMSVNKAFAEEGGMHCLIDDSNIPVMVCSTSESATANQWCIEAPSVNGSRHFACTDDKATFRRLLSRLQEAAREYKQYDGMPGSEISIHRPLQRF